MYSLSNIDYFIEAIKTPLRINEGLLLFILHRFKNPKGFVESRYKPNAYRPLYTVVTVCDCKKMLRLHSGLHSDTIYNPPHITLEFVRAFEGTPLGYVGECRHCGRVHYIDLQEGDD